MLEEWAVSPCSREPLFLGTTVGLFFSSIYHFIYPLRSRTDRHGHGSCKFRNLDISSTFKLQFVGIYAHFFLGFLQLMKQMGQMGGGAGGMEDIGDDDDDKDGDEDDLDDLPDLEES